MSEYYEVRGAVPPDAAAELGQYPELLQTLLYWRGITTAADAELFLRPDYEQHTHDPFVFAQMQDAVGRVLHAVEAGERITVFSDYDCDGIPGAAIMHDCLRNLGHEQFSTYIPHRHDEGYGLNAEAVDTAAADGATLLITIDCGTADTELIARARRQGIDVIICDHHEANGHDPDAILLNPKSAGETYPYRELCGAAVVFKLVQAIVRTLHATSYRLPATISPGQEKWMLDMVGIATLSDMVPLTGENRVFAAYGLTVLRKTRRRGLLKLLEDLRIQRSTLSEDDVGFVIAPRINAASRMDSPEDAFRLLTTTDDEEARRVTQHLHEINDQRKGHVASIVKELKKRMKDRPPGPVIITGDTNWRPSLLGLAANTLAEEYGRPVFLWGRDGAGELKGSARSDGSASVVDLMNAASDIFSAFGGHAFSGGFSVPAGRVHELEARLADAYARHAREAIDTQQYADARLTLDDVAESVYAQIAQLAPFGEGNPKPVFVFEDIEVVNAEHFGKQKNHLKLTFENSSGRPVTAIGFFQTTDSHGVSLERGARITLLATMEKSYFRGRPELRLRIVDIIPA